MLISFYNNQMLKSANEKAIETQSDEQLMELYVNNKHQAQRAFSVLYERHKGPLYRFVLKSINNDSQADEIYQDLWFRIIQHQASFNPKQVFTTWAYTIARRLLIDYYRKQGRQYSQSFDESEPDHNHDTSIQYQLPEQVFQQKRHAKALHLAVADLPAAQREVFVLVHECDLTLQQIADIIEQPKERIKSRYRYAIHKLRNTLKALI